MRTKILVTSGISLLVIILFLLIIVVVAKGRETNFSSQTNRDDTKPTPSEITTEPSGTIVTRPTPTGTFPTLENTFFAKMDNSKFTSYQEFLDYYKNPFTEPYTSPNTAVVFSGSSKLTEAPGDWQTCKLKQYDLKFFFPKNGSCTFFDQLKSDRIGEINLPAKTDKGDRQITVLVNVFEGKDEVKNLLPLNEISNFASMKTLTIGGRQALSYVISGAEGSLFDNLEVKLDDHTVLMLWFQLKEFPGQEQFTIFSEDFNKTLNSFVNSIR